MLLKSNSYLCNEFLCGLGFSNCPRDKKHERSEGFKASRAVGKAQFAQKRVAYKMLLFETTSLKLPNLLKMVSHLFLTVLTNFSRPVRNVKLNLLSRATVRYLLILL
jgi:hypothetical protein